jgi:hypothetical protein
VANCGDILFISFLKNEKEIRFVKNIILDDYWMSYERNSLESYKSKKYEILTLKNLLKSYELDDALIRNIESKINGFSYIRASGDIEQRIRILNEWVKTFKECTEDRTDAIRLIDDIVLFLKKVMTSTILELTKITIEEVNALTKRVKEFHSSKLKIKAKQKGTRHILRIINAFEEFYLFEGTIISIK